MSSDDSKDNTKVETVEGFVVPTKHASSTLPSGKILDVVATAFSDKIMVMVHSNGRIGRMVRSLVNLYFYIYKINLISVF